MTSFARAERAALADVLLAAGPDAPTLCEGWATRDLAAHLVLRERRPDAAAGIMLRSVAGHTKHVQDRLAAGDYAALVERVRTPPLALRAGFLQEAMNLVEFFIHIEDVRRGSPGWTPRELPADHERALATWAQRSAKRSARRFPARILIRTTAAEPVLAGAGEGEPVLTVDGAPGEILLFFTGRQGAADVTIDGPDELVQRLRGARLNI